MEEDIMRQMEAARPDFERFADFADLNLHDVEIAADRLDFAKPYAPPPFLLSINGGKCAPLSAIHVVTGQAGAAKTMFCSMLCAAILSGEYENIECVFKDKEPTVLYIDTEMAEHDTIAMKNRVLKMAGWPIDDGKDAFVIYRLRDTDSPKEKMRKAFRAVVEHRPTVAFIDGGVDLTHDFNNIEESSSLVLKLMKLASLYNVCVFVVLHQNPPAGKFGGEKLTGHLGSFLERKANDIFKVTSEKDPASNQYTYKVSDLKSRGRAPIDEWFFGIQCRAGGFAIPTPVQAPASANGSDTGKINTVKAEEVSQCLYNYQYTIQWPATTRDCERLFKAAGMRDDVLRECVKIAKNRDFIRREPVKDGERSPRYTLNRVHIPPKPATQPQSQPQAATQPQADISLPFAPPTDEQPPF